MNILFFALNASYVHTNLAVRCLRDALSESGHHIKLLEKTLKDRHDDVLFDLYAADCDVYGFSCYIWNIREMLNYAEKLKLLLPKAKIVFGGPEVSFENETFFMQYPFIDCVIRGEGENAWKRLCASFPEKHSFLDDPVLQTFGKSEGILYDATETVSGNLLYYESVRGCPYRCAYCLSALSDTIRAKPYEMVCEDLLRFERLSAKIHVIKFVDRTFNFDRSRARMIWKALLSEKYTKCYHFEICASLLQEEDFEIIAQLPKGKVQFEVGVQSLNTKTREAIRRTDLLSLCLTNLERLYRLGNVKVHADLIAGLPFENYTSFAASFDGVYGKCDELQLGFLKLLKGSELRAKAEQFGCIYDPQPPYEVLQTNDLSYGELFRLKKIAEVIERYSNSGSFENAIVYLTQKVPSPFFLFEKLSSFLTEALTGLSQIKAYEKLRQFAATQISGEELEMFSEKLTLDYLVSENGKLPDFLKASVRYCDENTKKQILQRVKEQKISIFVPGTEVLCFPHESCISVIDRKNRIRYTLDL